MTPAERLELELAEARSVFYGFLSRALLTEPSPSFLAGLRSDEAVEHLLEMFPDADYQEELAHLQLECREGRLTVDEVALDFEGLFRVPGSRYLSPYESVYRPQLSGVQGRLWGPETAAVEQYYLREGLEPSQGCSELPDHVGVELEFMSHLCRQAAAALRAGDPAARQYQLKQQHFFREHLGTWGRALAGRLASQAQTSLYRFLGNLLNLFLIQEDNRFQAEGGCPAVEAPGACLEAEVRQ